MIPLLVMAFAVVSTWLFASHQVREEERSRVARICDEVTDFHDCRLEASFVENLNRKHGAVSAHFLAARTAGNWIKERVLGNDR